MVKHPQTISWSAFGAKMDQLTQRGAIKFLLLKGLSTKEIHHELEITYQKNALRYSTVAKWAAHFRRGELSIEDGKRSGRPKEVVVGSIIEKVDKIVMSDRRMTLQAIAECAGISKERIHYIIHKELAMKKVSARWVPRLLTPKMKRTRLQMSRSNLAIIEADPELFLQRLVTMDETWVHHKTPESKQATMQWKHVDSPTPTKAKVTQSAGKVMVSVFWDSDGVLLIDYLQKGKTINAQYYCDLLLKLREKIRILRPGKLSKRVLFLQDNASSHKAKRTIETLASCKFEILDHPPYSPDLAPSDFYLFPQLKKTLMGQRFDTDDDVITTVNTFFEDQPKTFYRDGLLKLKERYNKCVALKGSYVEK